MRVTIIPADQFVSIDGVSKNLDFDIDENITAVQWHGQSGIVEQRSGGARFISSLDEFADIIDLFNAPSPTPPTPTLSESKAVKLSQLAALRYQKEIEGFLFSGQRIATDDRAKTLLMGARIEAVEAIENNQAYSVNWKTESGFVTLDALTIIAISNAVRGFIQACFNAEKSHADIISALTTVTAVQNYDFTTNWP